MARESIVIMNTDLVNHTYDKTVMPDYIQESNRIISWSQVEPDLKLSLELVETGYIQHLVSLLEQGKIDGSKDWTDADDEDKCVCFIGSIGYQIQRENKSNGLYVDDDVISWKTFEDKYGLVGYMTPFQAWLYGIRPGDTPENNVLAAAFHKLLVDMIAARS